MMTKENLFFMLSVADANSSIYYVMYNHALELSAKHIKKMPDANWNNQKLLLNLNESDLKKYEMWFLDYVKSMLYFNEMFFGFLLKTYLEKCQAKKTVVKKIIKKDINEHLDYEYFDDKGELLDLLFNEKEKNKIITAYLNKCLHYEQGLLLKPNADFTFVFMKIDGILKRLYGNKDKYNKIEKSFLKKIVNDIESGVVEVNEKETIYNNIINGKLSGNPVIVKTVFPCFLSNKDFKGYYINKTLE